MSELILKTSDPGQLRISKVLFAGILPFGLTWAGVSTGLSITAAALSIIYTLWRWSRDRRK